MSTIEYNQLKASGLSFGEPRPIGEGKNKLGDMIPILYDGKVPVVVIGDRIETQRATLFVSSFGGKRLAMNLEAGSVGARSYNNICEFVRKKIESGSLDTAVPGIKKLYSVVGKIKPITDETEEGLFLTVTSGSKYFDIHGDDIEPIETFPSTISGVVAMRVNGVFVGPKSVKISLAMDFVMIGPKQKNNIIAKLIKNLDEMAMY
ncbi:hypothetical protein IWW37_005501 [Coemansia sp. RSA 2050]|nr:hypothetical protein IWW37_005501 [Coemansia sp. RSA 2050]KAJ2729848.1 hypothetical protein IW152_005474 [Coemansia sp. BCRC 34962]